MSERVEGLRARIKPKKLLESENSQLVATVPCALKMVCKSCHGTGYELKANHGYISADLCDCVQNCAACFGTLMKVEKGASKPCKSPNPKRIVSLFREAKIPSRYLNAEFATYCNFTGNGKETLSQIQRWIHKFRPENGPGLVLSGPVGVGKTYFLAAVGKYFCRKGLTVKFVDFHRLLAVIRAAYSSRKSEEEILAPLINAQVLIIDELGKGRNNDWEQEKLDQIVMGRYNQNKVIIASSNYTLSKPKKETHLFNRPLDIEEAQRSNFNPDVFESLEARVGKRVFSRLKETSLMLEMEGDNFRDRLSPNTTLDR